MNQNGSHKFQSPTKVLKISDIQKSQNGNISYLYKFFLTAYFCHKNYMHYFYFMNLYNCEPHDYSEEASYLNIELDPPNSLDIVT